MTEKDRLDFYRSQAFRWFIESSELRECLKYCFSGKTGDAMDGLVSEIRIDMMQRLRAYPDGGIWAPPEAEGFPSAPERSIDLRTIKTK